MNLKFRIWDCQKNRFHKESSWSEYKLFINVNGDVCEVFRNNECQPYHEVYKEYVICQFTGLQDKWNTDIYEGDIISNIFGLCSEVVFETGGFGVKGKALSLFEYFQNAEVIGNKFENPELLSI